MRAGTILLLSLVALTVAGCATRSTILVDSTSDMVLIVKPVKASVAVWHGGRWVENGKMTIPAGWVAGSEKAP